MIFLLELVALCSVYWFFWRLFRNYFVKSPLDNIPGPLAKSFWTGVFPQIFSPNGWDFHKQIAEKYGGVIKIKALFGENQLYVFDPKALHHIVVKDQYIYEPTSTFIEGNKIVFGPGLLSTLGDDHRKQRKLLNPVFSTAHLRELTPTFYDVSYKLRDAFSHKVMNGPQEIDVLNWTGRTALELIGQGGLGYSFDTLKEDSVLHPYTKSMKALIPAVFKIMLFRTYILVPLARLRLPKLMRFIIDILPWQTVHQIRDIADVMHNTSVEILKSKRNALEEGDEAVLKQIASGKDILSILMKANMEASKGDVLSEDELLAQITTFTFAAMDSTSGAISRILSVLSHHPEVQDRLRLEIIEARKRENGGDLSYDSLFALPYLEAVCRETLRLYPPVSILVRTTRQDVVLPLSTPIKGLDGREMTEIPIPNNTNIIVGILAANRNPEVWGPDSYEWKPERWLQPLPDSVSAARIPGAYSHLMTFVGGGRGCIGFKFAQLEMKVVLFLLIESFRFTPSKKEVAWRMNGGATPCLKADMDGNMPRSQLPIIVERV